MVVVDFVVSIIIYSNLKEIPRKSFLEVYIHNLILGRFPKTDIFFKPISEFLKLLTDTQKFYDIINNQFKA